MTDNYEAQLQAQLAKTIDAYAALHNHKDSANFQVVGKEIHTPHLIGGQPMIHSDTRQPIMEPHPEGTQLHQTALAEDAKLQALHDGFTSAFQGAGGPGARAYTAANPEAKPAYTDFRNTVQDRSEAFMPISKVMQ